MCTNDQNVGRSRRVRPGGSAETLLAATAAELADAGFEAMTMRSIAVRAGMAHATAYAYYSSKNHLVAELFWRRLQARPRPDLPSETSVERVVAVCRDLAGFFLAEPRLARAAATALLVVEPDVARLQVQAGGELYNRLASALGPDPDAAVLEALLLGCTGSMLLAGLGHVTFEQMGEQLARMATTVVVGSR